MSSKSTTKADCVFLRRNGARPSADGAGNPGEFGDRLAVGADEQSFVTTPDAGIYDMQDFSDTAGFWIPD